MIMMHPQNSHPLSIFLYYDHACWLSLMIISETLPSCSILIIKARTIIVMIFYDMLLCALICVLKFVQPMYVCMCFALCYAKATSKSVMENYEYNCSHAPLKATWKLHWCQNLDIPDVCRFIWLSHEEFKLISIFWDK